MEALKSLNVVTPFNRTIIGTLSAVEGFQKIEFTDTNLVGDKQIMLDAFFEGQEPERMWCSKEVSRQIRAKELALSQIPSLPFALQTRADGSEFYQIQVVGSSGTKVTVDAAKAKAAPKAKVITVAELETMVAY